MGTHGDVFELAGHRDGGDISVPILTWFNYGQMAEGRVGISGKSKAGHSLSSSKGRRFLQTPV